jgi:lipopolysaccharide export system protein LptA
MPPLPSSSLGSALRHAFVGVAVAAMAVAPVRAAGQSGACRFGAGTGSFQAITLAGGDRIVYVSRPNIICDDGVRIRADSAVTSTMQNMSHLMGNVRYSDGARQLTSDEARYFSRQGRLQAHGNVFLADTTRGSEIENGDLIYLRQTSYRDEEEITVTRNISEGVRPRAVLYVRPAPDTLAVVDSLAAVGDSLGAVEGGTVPAVLDSLAVKPDTAGAELEEEPDTAVAALDSLAVEPDTASAVLDSLGVEPDTADVALEEEPDTADVALEEEPDTAVAELDSLAVEPDIVAAMLEEEADSAAVGLDSLAAEPDTAGAVPEEEADTTQVPFVVEGDRLFLQGDRFFRAVGRVEIVRDSLHAFSDTARYDQAAGSLALRGSARVEGEAYDLSGRDVDLGMPDGDIRTVKAVREGVLTGDGLRLVSPVIEIFLADGAMERLVATPLRADSTMGDEPLDSVDLVRPVAVAEEFRLTADSVEVLAPGQAMDRINAVGGARGESTSRDSLNVEGLPEAARRDWLEGDTVVAIFVEAQAPVGEPVDTAAPEYVVDRIVASGDARSLYRMVSSDSSSSPGEDAPAVHYVTGATIVIVLNEGELERMEVEGPTRGWHLEPLTSGVEDTTAAGDTLTPPDTLGPDTTAVRGSLSPATPDVAAGTDGRSGGEHGQRAAAHPAPRSRERARRWRSPR